MEVQEVKDPRMIGVGGLKSIARQNRELGINQLKRDVELEEEARIEEEQNKSLIQQYADNYRETTQLYNKNSPYSEDVGFVGLNDARTDRKIDSLSQLSNLPDTRGELQSGWAQITNGVAKGAILAGTTFLNGTLGLLYGVSEYNGNKGTDKDKGFLATLWDNDFSKAMDEVTKASEELLPNYYTDAERNDPWTKHIISGNFLGDKFIKNLGFTVGAIYSGGVASALLRTTRIPALIGALTKSVRTAKVVTGGIGAMLSAVNEGRIEALNNSNEWYDYEKLKLDDSFKQRSAEIEKYKGFSTYNALVEREQKTYEESLAKLEEDRLLMGNTDLMFNIPILTASNIFQFGRMFSNGFKTARITNKIKGSIEEGYRSGLKGYHGVIKGLGNALSEGTEEITQKMASEAAGNYYEKDLMNFFNARTDPNAEQETLSYIKSLGHAINKTVNDGSSWEEFFIGALTGAMGLPSIKMTKTNTEKFKRKLQMEGGIVGAIRDNNAEMERLSSMVEKLNQRIKDPKFQEYYQGMIRHLKYQKDMNKAVAENSIFDFKNAEFAQLISDIVLFDNAGKLGDLSELIDHTLDTSDENLESLVKNTSSAEQKADGTEILNGPFVTNGKSMLELPGGKEEMIKKIEETKELMHGVIDNYVKTKNWIDANTNEVLSDTQLEDLVWTKTQIDNWKERRDSIYNDAKKTLIEKAIPNITAERDALQKKYDKSRKRKKPESKISKKEKEMQDKINNLNSALENINLLTTIGAFQTAKLLSEEKNEDQSASNLDIYNSILLYGMQGESIDEVDNLLSGINDMPKLQTAIESFNTKLDEYLKNPGEQIEAQQRSLSRREKKLLAEKSKNLKEQLANSKSLQEFKEVLDNEEDENIKKAALDTLEEENNDLIKQYKDTKSYYNDVMAAVDKIAISPNEREDALKLLQDQYDNAGSIEELANPQSVHINNQNKFVEDSQDAEEATERFANAQYVAQSALAEVNSAKEFKDRFDDSYKKAPERKKSKEDNKSDNTSVKPDNTQIKPEEKKDEEKKGDKPQKSEEQLVELEVPVGDVSFDNVSEENKDFTNETDNRQKPVKVGGRYKFIIPALSYYSLIEARKGNYVKYDDTLKEGDPNKAVYEYLEKNGAFERVDNGSLKVGDEIGFMIDPAFSESVIFIVDKDGNVVGSLDTNLSRDDSFEGMNALRSKILQEYKNRTSKEGKFIASPKTKVSKMMTGKVEYTKEEKNLADVDNVLGHNPLFAIMQNGAFNTGGAVRNADILCPQDMSGKEGRLYLLIPAGSGKYVPVAVRVKHFNEKEMNVNDVANDPQNNSVIQGIMKIINEMSLLNESNAKDRLTQLSSALKNYLFTRYVSFSWFNDKNKSGILIRQTLLEPDGSIATVVNDKGVTVPKVVTFEIPFTKTADTVNLGDTIVDRATAAMMGIEMPQENRLAADIANDILNTLQKLNLGVQISIGQINDGSYNENRIKSRVLSSNISNAQVKGTWFVADYFDDQGEYKEANFDNKKNDAPLTAPTNTGQGNVQGMAIYNGHSEKTYYVDYENGIIKDENGNDITDTLDNYTKLLTMQLAKAQLVYGDNYEGVGQIDGIVKVGEYSFLNRRNGKMVENPSETERLEKKFKDIEFSSVVESDNNANDTLKQQQDKNDSNQNKQEDKKDEKENTPISEQPSSIDLINNAFNDKKPSVKRRRPSKPKTRLSDKNRKVFNKEKELAWLNNVLPQLSQQDRLRVVDGLIRVAGEGVVAWGMLDNGMVVISDIAAEGTVYHEAFHVVFNLISSKEQRLALLKEARAKWGDLDVIELEEKMAEDFREYVMTKDSRNLGLRMIRFFKDLWFKATHWKYIRSHLNAYYKAINEGQFSKEQLNDDPIETKLAREEYTYEMNDIIAKAKADGTFMKAPNGKPSNLNERQWVHVRTKAFKEWFGDWENDSENASKIVDENGEPLVVYHGSPNIDITEFKHSIKERQGGRGTGVEGYYFTPKRSYAERYKAKHLMYSPEDVNGGKVYEVFLNIKNPTEFNNKNYPNSNVSSFYNMQEKDRKMFELDGHDGVILGNVLNNYNGKRPEIVVFNKNQIKSATDNLGTYNSHLNEIDANLDSSSFDFGNRPKIILRKKFNWREHRGAEILATLPAKVQDKVTNNIESYLATRKSQGESHTSIMGDYVPNANATTTEVLDNIIKKSANKDLVELAKAIKKRLPKERGVYTTTRQSSREGLRGQYTADNKVNLYPKATYGITEAEARRLFESVILHEITHSITSDGLSANKQFREEVAEVMGQLNDYLVQNGIKPANDLTNTSDFYFFKNEKEFLSEFMSSPVLREALKQMEYKDTGKVKKSLFKKVVDTILRFFGMRHSSTLFERTEQIFEDISKYQVDENYNRTDDIEANEESSVLNDKNSNKWNELTNVQKQELSDIGYFEEVFNSYPESFQDQLIKCRL